MTDRRVLTGIASTAWEHPADRAALQTLRAIPGFDEVVRRVMGFIGERGVRWLFTANAVKVGPRQRPKLYALYQEVLQTLDWPEAPDLFVTQTPDANAAAVGFQRPFIVLNSGALSILDDDERRVLLGHEVGHVMSGHTTYTTLAQLILNIGMSGIPGLSLITLPIRLALLEWYRKAEFSADRAGLLAAQDISVAMGMFLKFAGGVPADDETNLDEYLAQAEEYETAGNVFDAAFKLFNTVDRTHPFNTVRAAELQRWVKSGDYEAILNDVYPRRGDEERPLNRHYADAAAYYGEQTRESVRQVNETLTDVLSKTRDAFGDLFRGRSDD